ncbi:MAG: dihydrolipoyl dehydrogenase [Lachnospiraceae bacterium]|nr:dihydrolipoyl dehydrogenase [Lachnospiraceae bacterium]
MDNQFKVVIIGGGPAGYEAAIESAKLGMKTALVEARELGGTCLNRGCIPTKTILHSVDLYAEMKKSAEIGIHAGEVTYNMEEIQNRKEEVLTQLRTGIQGLMKKNKVTVFQGKGTILDANHVQVAGEETVVLEAENILIATGSVPSVPPIPGVQLPNVLTSDEMLDKKDVYPSLTIIGGGVIGMEFAAIYSELGCKVTVVEFLDRILANMDKEISQSLKMLLKKKGVDIFTGARVEEIVEGEEGKLVCRYSEKEQIKEVVSDGILVAVGRRTNTEGLFGEGFALDMERGRILVNENYQTSVPNIYAAGDVIGGIMLAHAATAEAINAIMHIAGEKPLFNMTQVPGCVYTNPEIGNVGISADDAKKAGLSVISKKYPMSANGKSLLSNQERGFIKIVADAETHKILGATMMCARATDMVSQFATAIVNGLTIEQMAAVIYPHPTFSEGISETLRS